MSTLVTDLFEGLRDEIAYLVNPVPVTRRYMPLLSVSEMGTEVEVSVYLDSRDKTSIGRNVSTKNIVLGIAVQKAVTASQDFDGNGDPVNAGIDNLEQGDEVLQLVEKMLDFWGDDPEDPIANPTQGVLREKVIAGCCFQEIANEPIYEPLHLVSSGIFSSIIDVTYQHGG